MWWHHFLFCFSAPQFDQDNLKKSAKPSRLDDIHGFHRGRRQSGQGQSSFYYWEDQSINQSISQSISQSIDRSIDRSIDWAIDQIFVMCFKDLSRFKYKVGCRFRFLEDWTETTWVQASEVLSHPELDSTERSASGEALEEFLSMEEESTAVNHIWLTNSPTFLLWIWISEMFYIRTQKTETFFFFDHDQEGKSWTYRAICFDRTKLKITREQKLKTRAEESLVKCEMLSECFSCILMKSSPTTTTATVWGVLPAVCHIRSGSAATELHWRVQTESLFALFVPPEPPELLMYTPEKSRKSLPLLLEGNLPYRRSRRQSGTTGFIHLQPSVTCSGSTQPCWCPDVQMWCKVHQIVDIFPFDKMWKRCLPHLLLLLFRWNMLLLREYFTIWLSSRANSGFFLFQLRLKTSRRPFIPTVRKSRHVRTERHHTTVSQQLLSTCWCRERSRGLKHPETWTWLRLHWRADKTDTIRLTWSDLPQAAKVTNK